MLNLVSYFGKREKSIARNFRTLNLPSSMALWWPGRVLMIISPAIYRRRVTWVCETCLLNYCKVAIRIWYYSQCRIFRRLQAQKVYTIDIKSSYTVIPNNSGLEALAYWLNKRPALDPPTSTVTRLAELVLTLNAFTFNGDFYQQIGGVAMSSKMSPNYACPLDGYVEGRIVSQYHGFVPELHKRYIDDVIGVACCSPVELKKLYSLRIQLSSCSSICAHNLWHWTHY